MWFLLLLSSLMDPMIDFMINGLACPVAWQHEATTHWVLPSRVRNGLIPEKGTVPALQCSSILQVCPLPNKVATQCSCVQPLIVRSGGLCKLVQFISSSEYSPYEVDTLAVQGVQPSHGTSSAQRYKTFLRIMSRSCIRFLLLFSSLMDPMIGFMANGLACPVAWPREATTHWVLPSRVRNGLAPERGTVPALQCSPILQVCLLPNKVATQCSCVQPLIVKFLP